MENNLVYFEDLQNGDIFQYTLDDILKNYTFLMIDKTLRKNGQCLRVDPEGETHLTWFDSNYYPNKQRFIILEHIDMKAISLT